MSEMQEEQGAAGIETSNGLSILSRLKERRQEVLEEQVLELSVPRWTDPQIVVKYKPVEHSLIRAAQNRVKAAPEQKKADVEVDVNADLLIRGCIGVVAVIDGEEYSLRDGDPTGEPTRFDADLAENLGVAGVGSKPPTARQVVRALFITEPDILSAAARLGEFSGYREAEADEAVQGE